MLTFSRPGSLFPHLESEVLKTCTTFCGIDISGLSVTVATFSQNKRFVFVKGCCHPFAEPGPQTIVHRSVGIWPGPNG